MRILIQRVSEASVKIEGKVKSKIDKGLLIFVGIENDDDESDIDFLAKKSANLRIFDDENGVMNKSVMEIGGDILIVSQFTLYASTKKGNRPSYIRAAKQETAVPLYEKFCVALSNMLSKQVFTGVFGADMKVKLINDGPVTICIDSKVKK